DEPRVDRRVEPVERRAQAPELVLGRLGEEEGCLERHAEAPGLGRGPREPALQVALGERQVDPQVGEAERAEARGLAPGQGPAVARDRKSTRLNSSHGSISYAVFCLKKKTDT